MSAKSYNPFRPGANYTGPSRSWTEGLGQTVVGAIDERSLAFVGVADPAPSTPSVKAFEGRAEITDVQVIGSFNWTVGDEAKILIPGSPPIWKDDPLPFTLQSDREVYAKPAAEPASPTNGPAGPTTSSTDTSSSPHLGLLALIASTQLCTPSFQWSSADIVTGRDSLLCLLRWVASSPKLNDFRIDLHLAGGHTVVFTRWIPRREQAATPGSFGVSYERNQTRPAVGCENGRWGGHQRVLSYDFGGLRIITRSQSGARLPLSPNELVDELARVNLLEDEKTTVEHLGDLTYRRAGTLTPQAPLVELVTRTKISVKNYHRKEAYPVLAFGATPNHIIALHKYGTFYEIKHERVGIESTLVAAALATEDDFRKLRVVLDTIKDLVVRNGMEKRLSLLCRDDKLEVFERIEGAVLPGEFEAAFA